MFHASTGLDRFLMKISSQNLIIQAKRGCNIQSSQHKMMRLHNIKREKQCHGSALQPRTLDANMISIKTR